ncbi:MAG: FAD binding domain-containing protein [Xanthobacteraceae bacterium]
MATVAAIAASRKRIAPFRLLRPSTVEALCELKRQWPDALLHAGGIDLVSRMKAGLVMPAVIDLGALDEIKGVRQAGDTVEIGAATTHWQIEHDGLLRTALPAVPDFVAGLGNVRVRVQGTIGGNVMAAEAGYEMLPLLAALDAELRFVDCENVTRQSVPARVCDMGASAATRLLAVIAIPLRGKTVTWDRSLRPQLGLVAALDWREGMVVSGFAALTGCGRVWASLPLVRPLSRNEIAAASAAIAEGWVELLPPLDGLIGLGRDYCRHAAQVMLRRAITRMAHAPA